MKNIVIGALILVAGVTFMSCKKDEEPTTVTKRVKLLITKDAQISSYSPTGSHGSYHIISAQSWTVGGNPATQRALIDPDLSSIPAGATITKATLNLRSDSAYNYSGGAAYGHSQLSGSNDATLRRITSSWDEATITWNTAPTTDDVNAVSLDASSSAKQNYSIDVLPLVIDQYKSPSSYFGFQIQLNTEVHYRSLIFGSSDGSNANFKPSLTVEYSIKE